MSSPHLAAVRDHLLALQARWCADLEKHENDAAFQRHELPGERGGMARPWVLSNGSVLESAAAMFSHTSGARLPKAATARRPALTGGSFEAVSLSTIVHPRNPHAPTMHANLRLFQATPPNGQPVWWFGGGFDLTPYYGYEADAIAWHRAARKACEVLGPTAYPEMKAGCDRYFHLPHRDEARGIGGIFFDDLDQPDFDTCFAFVQAVGDAFVSAYLPILERRRATETNAAERAWQTYRRGRYVEFNLLHDRGTLFGLQAGGRTESILASLPPTVTWRYDHTPPANSAEARLLSDFLPARDWLA